MWLMNVWQEGGRCWCWLHCCGTGRHPQGTWIWCISAHSIR